MKKKSSDFNKFDEVMIGLLAVPYSELQKKLEQEKRDKAENKKKRSISTASSPASASGKRRGT